VYSKIEMSVSVAAAPGALTDHLDGAILEAHEERRGASERFVADGGRRAGARRRCRSGGIRSTRYAEVLKAGIDARGERGEREIERVNVGDDTKLPQGPWRALWSREFLGRRL
jgi:hypothetical protein